MILKSNDMCPYKSKVEGELSQTEDGKTWTRMGDIPVKMETEIAVIRVQAKEY